MRVTITETGLEVDDAPPVTLAGIGLEDRATVAFILAATWAMQRITEECGMCMAGTEARQAIQTAKGQ